MMASPTIRVDRTTTSQITMLTLFGTVDESFHGGKTATSIRTPKLVLNLREVRRFASWGMAEWMNFLRAAAEIDLYFVECSSYAVQQMNLVTGLLGHGKLVSFYAPYRCNSCSEEFDLLVVLGHDRSVLETLETTSRTCVTCGGSARLGKYTAEIAAAIAKQPAYDIDDEVVGFLRARFKYEITPNTNRFRALRREKGQYSYVRMSGNLATLPATVLAANLRGTTILDLSQVSYDPTALDGWRSFLNTALSNVTSLQLLACPTGFIRHALDREQLQTKVKVRTFALSYGCGGCGSTTAVMIDVAQNLEDLTAGIVPSLRCSKCGLDQRADIDEAVIRQLPARERDPALDEFLARSRAIEPAKLENCLAARPAMPAKTTNIAKSAFIGSTLAAIVVGALFVGVYLWKQEPSKPDVPDQPLVAPPLPTFHRPDWILSDAPLSSFCNEQTNRVVCVGVSSSNANRSDAVVEANDAALEELVNSVGLKVSVPWFRKTVVPGYSAARAKALSSLQNAETSEPKTKYVAAADAVRKTRHRIVEILQASGGPAVPAQRSDWYWEEYASDKGQGTEFLVFVRYDIALESMTALTETYSGTTQIAGGSFMTAFPSLAWQHETFAGGAIVTKVDANLEALGFKPQQLVIAVGDEQVKNAETIASRLATTSGSVEFKVRSNDAAPKTILVTP